jgi:hypothetical protein
MMSQDEKAAESILFGLAALAGIVLIAVRIIIELH